MLIAPLILAPTASAEEGADVRITSLASSPVFFGSVGHVTASIRNIGALQVETALVHVFADDVLVHETTYDLTSAWAFSAYFPSGAVGPHSVRVVVDPLDAIAETNEENNVAVGSFETIPWTDLSILSFEATQVEQADAFTAFDLRSLVCNHGVATAAVPRLALRWIAPHSLGRATGLQDYEALAAPQGEIADVELDALGVDECRSIVTRWVDRDVVGDVSFTAYLSSPEPGYNADAIMPWAITNDTILLHGVGTVGLGGAGAPYGPPAAFSP